MRARACAFRFWQGCARWCAVRAFARVRRARVVGARCGAVHGARVVGARCGAVRRVCHACTLSTVPTLPARVPTPPTVQRFSAARCWCAVRASLVRAPCRACRCASFLRVVASLWLTVRRFMVYGAVVVSVPLHGTSNPGNPHRTR
jgi:hypothetical protein